MPSSETEEFLDAALRSMVRRFGIDRVDRSLRKITRSKRQFRGAGRNDATTDARAAGSVRKKRSRLTAAEYVEKMEISPDLKSLLMTTAEKFQNKSFLPTAGDVRNFFGVYGIDGSSFDSRVSAMPRLFRFLASMSPDEVERMLDGGMFSGPARLGPIADAMREAGRPRMRPAVSNDKARKISE